MLGLIRQRNNSDCAVCTLAMALGVSYDEVLALCPDYRKRLADGIRVGLSIPDYLYVARSYGFTFRSVYPHTVNKEYGDDFWEYLSEKIALLVVHSLNYKGRLHSVYWDGLGVYDPSKKRRYNDVTIRDIRPRPFELFPGVVKYGLVLEPDLSD